MKQNAILTDIMEAVQNADLVCFDIFDTLITRKVLHPVDVFLLAEELAKARSVWNGDFKTQRIRAERMANEQVPGGHVTLKDIYAVLSAEQQLTAKQTDELMNLELEAEGLLTVPRTDVRDFLTELYRSGKKLLLVSDMYLTAEQLRPLLATCGYPEDLPILVSCQEGKSKSDGSLWKKVLQAHPGERIVHIGDNPRSDYHNAIAAGVNAFLIPNPAERFTKEKLYSCLGIYDDGSFGNSLLLGTIVNEILYNHAFDSEYDVERLMQLWLGPVFANFSRWLAHNEDDCLLLFVTRENYILRPMYLEYCRVAGIQPRPNCDFYASRQATAAAAFKNQDNYEWLFQEGYEGTLADFVRSRCAFVLPEDDPNREKRIILPGMRSKTREYLEPYHQQIIDSGAAAAEIYRIYVDGLREEHPAEGLSIVDLGYKGAAQYYLSLALDERVGGEYLFLNSKTMPQLLSCPEKCVSRVTDGRHPLYDNQLVLEAAMQVPCGQLRYLEKDEQGRIVPVRSEPVAIWSGLKEMQDGFLDYVREEATWDRYLKGRIHYSLALAEDIFAAMVVCNLLPEEMLTSLQLEDAFHGYNRLRYNKDKMRLESDLEAIPFVYTEPGYRLPLKLRIKNFVKTYIPIRLYETFRLIWVKYIK